MLDPPEARALVLEQGDLRIALVAIDLVIARPEIRDPLLDASRSLGIDSLILAATHTHSGPGAYLEGWAAARMTAGSFDPEAPGRLARAALLALERAAGDLAPVRAGGALGRLDLAENRREENGPRETALPVLKLEGPSGRRGRVLFGYAAHPTVLSKWSHSYSGDYPGAARAWLAGQGWDATFLAGPLGDQQPRSEVGPLWPDSVEEQRAQAREIGERVGHAVLSTLSEIRPVSSSSLVAVERWVELPESRLRRGCLVWWLGPFLRGSLRRFLSPRVPFHAVQIGDTVLLALPAEPTTRVGERLRAQIPDGQVPMVVVHANDWVGYVVDADRYRRGGYEACLAFHGPGLADWLVEESAATIALLRSRASAARSRPDRDPGSARSRTR